MIRVTEMSFSYSGVPVFDRANFTVGQNQKAGLVGPNGAGKSTLFKLLQEIEMPSTGKIDINGKIGFVPQEVTHDHALQESSTIRAYIDPQQKKTDQELSRMLHGLELGHLDIYNVPQHVSGGQKTKLALARALIAEPDVLLLDEPTNFMDTAGKKWVMQFLSTYPKTLFLVSHDLALMDQHIQKVIVIDTFHHKIEEYSGTYSDYIRLKKEHDEQIKREITNQQKHIKHMEKGIEKMARFTSKKGVRARTVLKRRVEKLKATLPEMPRELQRIKLQLPQPLWVGEIPLKAIGIDKAYGNNVVLENVHLTLRRGERVALIGRNGAGKSTLLKILMGILPADGGEVTWDSKVKVGYYSQELEAFDLEKSLIETVKDSTAMHESQVRGFLARFLFGKEKVLQKVGSLSGGEKTRLSIALLVLHDYNVLILDEPTTYLDVLSQRIILDALKRYSGTMLVVSHTEEFIQELAPKHALLLPENKFVAWDEDLLTRVGVTEG